jgi:hypothetical protein
MKKSKKVHVKRIKKIQSSNKAIVTIKHENLKKVHCSKCGSDMRISFDSVEGVCWRCVCVMTPPDLSLLKQPSQIIPSGKPRGWQKMKLFVDKSGDCYIKGILQPALKDSLPETVKKEKSKRISKKQKISTKHSEGAIIFDLKKKLQITKSEKSKLKIQSEIIKHEQILNGVI